MTLSPSPHDPLRGRQLNTRHHCPIPQDFNRYNNPENEDEAQNETGWKVVHADVFRDPPYPGLLACYVGTGSQLLGMAVVTLGFACFGFLSPARRGSLMTAMLVLYALCGSVGGFVAAVMAKMFHEQSWATILMTGVWLPGKVVASCPAVIQQLQGCSSVPIGYNIPLCSLFAFGVRDGRGKHQPPPPPGVAACL